MGRTLNDENCEMTFKDKISNSNITVYYRLPESEERIAYSNALTTRSGNQIKNTVGEARRKYGTSILTGFKDGSFDRGKGRPISSDPASSHYEPAWKAFVKKYALDVIELLAVMVFEASLSNVDPENDEPKGEEGPDGEEEGPKGDPS